MDAGELSSWMAHIEAVLGDAGESDVPCGACTACCTSSQFVHIEPDEADTLRHLPPALMFAAPGRPPGHVVLPYDERGHCPMLLDGGCSIYAHRPRTCRRYDCRVFAATGITPDQPTIAARVREWSFTYANDDARDLHEALRAQATADDGAPAVRRAVDAIVRVRRR
ncbi:MAG: YkgJ family cysteine cluster protein [Acidobacteria bacterium]|nr:YkgJ family cysteine cluster protein [Acidobacteriota bacterium]